MLLSSDQEGELSNDPAWMLFISVTQYRFLKTMAFMIDLQSEVAQLSLRFQSSNVTPSDVLFSVQTCLRQLNRLKTEDGNELAEFLSTFDSRQNTYKGVQLSDVASGMSDFEEDRKQIISAAHDFIE